MNLSTLLAGGNTTATQPPLNANAWASSIWYTDSDARQQAKGTDHLLPRDRQQVSSPTPARPGCALGKDSGEQHLIEFVHLDDAIAVSGGRGRWTG
jgi:hypothetical protein